MTIVKLFVLSLVFLFSGTAMNAQSTDANPVITLERTACFGSCPIYTVQIFADGTVVYNGERFVEVEGEQTGQIEPETVEQMVEAFAEAGYFEWDEEYIHMTITDQPYITTSVTRDGETHTIRRYAGDSDAPLALPFLEAWIDVAAGTEFWTGVQTNLAALVYTSNTPVVTLQRGPCFGFCPVYNVMAFGDGTIVYTGIRHVDEIGVRVYQTHPDNVESVIHRAELSGYFNWNDSYEEMLVTDQSTVVTSIQTDDDYKRIVRYEGDPNAPIGLVRVEDSIDVLLQNAIENSAAAE